MASTTRPDREAIKVLIAEDSSTQAEKLRHLLEEQNYEVTVTRNGKEALAALSAHAPDLVISDVVMPEMDGYTLCKRIKSAAAFGDFPVILLTSLATPQDVIKGLQCGADGFIKKPYNTDYLLSRIDYTLANRRLRATDKVEMGLEIELAGQKYFITSERQQILDLLISTFQEAVHLNEELSAREKELRAINQALERETEERRLAVEETRKLNTKLETANRELSAFSYSVSHDLRAPLRAIDGFAHMILDKHAPGMPEDARRYLRVVCDNTQQMNRLIDDLLAFSRLSGQPLKTEAVAPDGIVKRVLQELDAQKEGRTVEIVLGSLPPCQADAALLKQVWVNLLANAFKYTRKRAGARIEIASRKDGGATSYYVKDNGVGFDMRYAGKLFGVFQRFHKAEEYEGTGVGLAIVQRIVNRHGGRIWAEAEVDKGATFYFTLEGEAPGELPDDGDSTG